MPSSVISTFRYDKVRKDLIVVFVSGTAYSYKDVPEAVYEEMKASFSKGAYLNDKIKPTYKFEKMA